MSEKTECKYIPWKDVEREKLTDLIDREMVGVVGVNPAGVIWMLYVHPAYQGCGVGSALFAAPRNPRAAR